MDVERITRLVRDLESWSLNFLNAPRELRKLKERVVMDCRLSPDEIDALPEDTVGLRQALLEHAINYRDELEGLH